MTVDDLRDIFGALSVRLPDQEIGKCELEFASGYGVTYVELVFTASNDLDTVVLLGPKLIFKGDKSNVAP